MKYKIINGVGVGKSIDEKIKDSKKRYNVKCKIIGGEIAAYGSPEYSIIETLEDLDSPFMQSLQWNCIVESI